MRIRGILGQEQAKALLERALDSGRLPHALLFQGPEGTGKATVARRLAASLLCLSEEAPCGSCRSCAMLEHGNHPDFLLVEREPRPDEPDQRRGFILVDQIREVARHAASAPREGRSRFFLIDPADRMNAEAQNALLKTLEEPPGRSVLVLVSSRPHALLPTVRSRCLTVRFSPVDVEALAAHLHEEGMPMEEARARAALASGRPGLARTLDLDGIGSRREAALSSLEALARSPSAAVELAAMAKDLAGDDYEDLAASLELVEGLLRDAAVIEAGGGSPVHADLSGRLGALGRKLGAGRAAALVAETERLVADLRFNPNRTLVAETLLAAVAGGPVGPHP